MITRLSAISEIAVRPITSVRKYAAVDQDPSAAGRELNVDIVVDGTVHRAGQQVRITARAIRVSDELTVWSGQFEEDIGDIFTVEDRVSEQMTMALALKLSGEEKELFTRPHTANAEAYQLYLTGPYHWNQRTEAAIKKSIEFYSRAIASDSSYPAPYSGIGDAYTALGYLSFLAPTECFPKARDAANRALELDPTLAEPHTSLAYVKLYYDWDYGVALIWAGLGDRDQAFAWLDKALADRSHWLVWLKIDPRWDPIRSDSRFDELVRRVGL